MRQDTIHLTVEDRKRLRTLRATEATRGSNVEDGLITSRFSEPEATLPSSEDQAAAQEEALEEAQVRTLTASLMPLNSRALALFTEDEARDMSRGGDKLVRVNMSELETDSDRLLELGGPLFFDHVLFVTNAVGVVDPLLAALIDKTLRNADSPRTTVVASPSLAPTLPKHWKGVATISFDGLLKALDSRVVVTAEYRALVSRLQQHVTGTEDEGDRGGRDEVVEGDEELDEELGNE